MFFFLIFYLTLFSIIATTTPVPPNLLTNPGADSGLTGWTQGVPPNAIVDTGGIYIIMFSVCLSVCLSTLFHEIKDNKRSERSEDRVF